MPLLNKTRPLYRHLYEDIYRMHDKLRYMDNETGEIYEVEEGTEWDKGTVARIVPRFFVPHGDEMTYPSAIHDQHYKKYTVTRRVADRVLRQFLIEEKLHPARAWAAWSFVRMNLKAQWRWGKNGI